MRNKIYLMNALFLFPMWMSKTLQPLYWDLENKLDLFSASYVSMAIAGTFSLLYAGIVRKLGIRTGLIIGYVFYAVGLILRAYPVNLTVAILTGLIAGIGASVTGLALKGLLLEIKEEKRKTSCFRLIISILCHKVWVRWPQEYWLVLYLLCQDMDINRR